MPSNVLNQIATLNLFLSHIHHISILFARFVTHYSKMRLTIPFLAIFTGLVLAAPQDDQTSSPDMMLRASDFQAYSSDAQDGYSNWIAFIVSDDAHTMMATCSAASSEELYSDTKWYPCKVYTSDSTMNLSFQVSHGCDELRLKKSWESSG